MGKQKVSFIKTIIFREPSGYDGNEFDQKINEYLSEVKDTAALEEITVTNFGDGGPIFSPHGIFYTLHMTRIEEGA